MITMPDDTKRKKDLDLLNAKGKKTKKNKKKKDDEPQKRFKKKR